MTAPISAPTVTEIRLADEPERWESLGFTVAGGAVQLGTVRVALVGQAAGRGILGWSLCGISSSELDGLPTTPCEAPTSTDEAPTSTDEALASIDEAPIHANAVTSIDHVVAMSPALDRSVQALQVAGVDLRRIREQPTPAGAPRQAFFRLGEVILELVQEPDEVVAARPSGDEGPARFWGLALLSANLEQTVEQLGEHVSEIRPAVQPGRRIATLRRSAGLGVPVALMSHAVS